MKQDCSATLTKAALWHLNIPWSSCVFQALPAKEISQHYGNLQWDKTISISSKATNFNGSSVKKELLTDW